MWENRISAQLNAIFGQAGQGPLPRPQAPSDARPGCPHVIQRMDIYQAARARAVFEQQLGKLFNPDASAE